MKFKPNTRLVEFIRKESIFGSRAYDKSKIRGMLISWAQETPQKEFIDISEKERDILAAIISDATVHGSPDDDICFPALRNLLGNKAELVIKRCLADREGIEQEHKQVEREAYLAAKQERRRKTLDERS